MCGRYKQTTALAILKDIFGIKNAPDIFQPVQIVTPGRHAPVVTADRNLEMMSWGLVPSWAKDKTIARHTFNARQETLAEKPAFREAFRQRRCLVPANGFYEWSPDKRPYFIQPPGHPVFAFAGLWDEGQGGKSFTIVTQEAPPALAGIHARFPVILMEKQDFITWTSPKSSGSELAQLLSRQASVTPDWLSDESQPARQMALF